MMIKAVLLDLDNTLIQNNDHAFTREFLRLANRHFRKRLGCDNFTPIINTALRTTGSNHHIPSKTNTGLIIDTIAQMMGHNPDEARSALSDFYREVYPELQALITPVSGAAELIADLKQRGYAVVIATNPLYPAEAVYSRLKWGGLVEDPNYYSFITSADNMHFSKPNPAYYAEIIGNIGLEPDEVIVVGDSMRNDIQSASALGIHTFHITGESGNNKNNGNLQDFHDKMTGCKWLHSLLPHQQLPEMIEPQLLGNIGAFFNLVDKITADSWNQHPDPNEWSPLQIVAHLLESEDNVERPRLEMILAQDSPFITVHKNPLGPEQFICAGEGIEKAEQFTQSRYRTIQFLRTLKPDDWYRPARHSIFGPTDLLEMVYFTAQHDRLHLHQLNHTLCNCP
jgi:HAD superfamily hydrolase (TIGR01549 family)